MKNPENKPLRIVSCNNTSRYPGWDTEGLRNYGLVLSNLAVAQSNLIKAGKDSALPHFIAIVKELEKIYGFEFRIMEEPIADTKTE